MTPQNHPGFATRKAVVRQHCGSDDLHRLPASATGLHGPRFELWTKRRGGIVWRPFSRAIPIDRYAWRNKVWNLRLVAAAYRDICEIAIRLPDNRLYSITARDFVPGRLPVRDQVEASLDMAA